MRRAVIAASGIGLVAAAATNALAGSSPPGRAQDPYAGVTLTECHPSAEVSKRYASFTGRMDAVPGSALMAMRFTLLERRRRWGRFRPVRLAELRRWRRSEPGADAFVYAQHVTSLHDGAAYRMRVHFRWYAGDGTLVQKSRARSRACRQPAPLPDLSISSIDAVPATEAGVRTYLVTLANTGAGEARHVRVALEVDGSWVTSSRIYLLPAQASTVVEMSGPPCGVSVRAIADPGRDIRERDESDNALRVPCGELGA